MTDFDSSWLNENTRWNARRIGLKNCAALARRSSIWWWWRRCNKRKWNVFLCHRISITNGVLTGFIFIFQWRSLQMLILPGHGDVMCCRIVVDCLFYLVSCLLFLRTEICSVQARFYLVRDGSEVFAVFWVFLSSISSQKPVSVTLMQSRKYQFTILLKIT
jgi:hypothetical protein